MRVTVRGLAASLLVLAAAALFVRLGFWQLHRLDERRERNRTIQDATRLPALRLEPGTLPELFAHPGAASNRLATARGVWEPNGEIVLRGRIREGRPGVHLVTPLRVRNSEVRVWVNRGWVAAPDGATPMVRPPPEGGEVEVRGSLQPVPRAERGGERATSGEGALSYRRLDLGILQERSPGPVLPLYLQSIPDASASGPPFPIPPPVLSEGSHLGYAVQWFSFAVIALAGLAVLVARRTSAE